MNAPERSDPERTALVEYLRWNSYLSERHHLLYIATPKVACTALKWWFAALEGCAEAIHAAPDTIESDPDLAIHDCFYRVAPQVTGLAPARIEAVLESPLYYRFALVRNPFTRIFSAWQSKLLLREPVQSAPYVDCDFFHWRIEDERDLARAFEGFLDHLARREAPRFRDAHWTPQQRLLRPDLVSYSRIARIEEPGALADELAVRLGPGVPSPFKAPRRNESLIPYLPQWVTPRSTELIRELYAADLEAFGYAAEPPPAKGSFSSAQLRVALDAIELLRARHRRLRDSRAALSGRIGILEQAVQSLEARIHELGHELVARDERIRDARHEADAHSAIIQTLRQEGRARDSRVEALETELAGTEQQRDSLRAELQAVYASRSWRLIRALQAVRRILISRPREASRRIFGAMFETARRRQAARQIATPGLDPALLEGLPPAWRTELPDPGALPLDRHPPTESAEPQNAASPLRTDVEPADDYTSAFEGPPPGSVPARLICFYRSQALEADALRRQVELAERYGIAGFCFYLYGFDGQPMTDSVPAAYLAGKDLTLPFCLCWANRQPTDSGQDGEPDDLAFIVHLEPYLRDPRYIRIGDRPLVLVDRPQWLAGAKQTAQRWRQWCADRGVAEPYLACAETPDGAAPARYGFDAAFERPPDPCRAPEITRRISPLSIQSGGHVFDWRAYVMLSERYPRPASPLFRGVFPGWDDTPRQGPRATVFVNNTPALYRRWLGNAIRDARERFTDPQSRLVFVNAWNAWTDGAHLEPDRRLGYARLQASRDALVQEARKERKKPSILIVTHDCHPHGAQFLILEIAKLLKLNGFEVRIAALDGGRLSPDFERVGSMINAKEAGDPALQQFLERTRREGTADAITSTVVAGAVVERLKTCGYRVLSLIHELPGVIREMDQQANAEAIARLSDVVVFPAMMVHRRFNEIAPVPEDRVLIRPQGVLRKNPYKNRAAEARREVLAKHGLPADCRIVLGVGYVDARKGADLFVEVAARVLMLRSDVAFIWIGHAGGVHDKVQTRIQELGVGARVLFVGFDREPMAYYAAASAYALPSREDPFPNVVLESAEVGVPVVAFDGASGAGQFIVQHGGRLARFMDVEDFARQTCELLDRPADASDSRPDAAVGSLQQYVLDLLHRLNRQPRVSVIVPSYNYARHIRARLDSIVAQRLPIYEIVILDDASSDGSQKIIDGYFDAAPAGSRVASLDARRIFNQRNSGSAFRQWQRGISECRGDLVWIAEADDLADEDFLEEMTAPFDDAGMVLAFCQSRQIDGRGKLLAPGYAEYTKGISNRWLLGYVRDGRMEIRDSLAIKNTIPNVSAVVFRAGALKRAFEALGDRLFEFRVAGDWLIYLEVLRQGKVCFNERPMNSHRRHASSVTRTLQATRHLNEVARLQQLARSLARPSDEVLAKAAAYLDELREYFALPRSAIIDAANDPADSPL